MEESLTHMVIESHEHRKRICTVSPLQNNVRNTVSMGLELLWDVRSQEANSAGLPGDAMQDCAPVIVVADSHSCHRELIMFVLEAF
jgi:hypothetical protein